ncbi:ABC-type sugar transport system, periplasmic component [Hoeflea sp. IMCC20628]|uniref:LacI family DNA-binding transcriptional regulator n=1 Tax=Hoeflea sp. IMCC20628 TaxID=1620421 RepID=UPI00063ADB71|nr:LacI family DNA-binding transcriptional regulator [Hoeflea sp. IMCC20628]AKH99012.1 ABC-type sugar transport system, periplasmic component [Hoeflea sp. IMCC20628]
MRPTVHDIAAEAGVSLATVDRVLNGRPGVRKPTVDKVEAAVSRLGYVRDVTAANLARKRVYPLVFIVPGGPNSFLQNLTAEITAAAQRSSVERTSIRIETVPPFDPGAIVSVLGAIDPKTVSGVGLVATDTADVTDAVNRLVEQGVPVVTLVSDLPGSQRIHYCGIDNIAAGRTAASLIGRFCSGRPGKVLVVAGSMKLSDHAERASGFAAVLDAEFPDLDIIGPVETNDNADTVRHSVEAALEREPEIVAIYNLGAGNRGLIEALARHKRKLSAVVAHEVTQHSRQALADGVFDAVINQDCGHEVRSAIRVLKARADGLDPLTAQERIRIDVFLRDNLP